MGQLAVLRHALAAPAKASPWLAAMIKRRPRLVVAVAMAAKTARVLWAPAAQPKRRVHRPHTTRPLRRTKKFPCIAGAAHPFARTDGPRRGFSSERSSINGAKRIHGERPPRIVPSSKSSAWAACRSLHSPSESAKAFTRRAAEPSRATAFSRHFAFSCQSPIAAPAGSMMMEKEPAPITSVTSLQTVAPSDFALAVAAVTSLTST